MKLFEVVKWIFGLNTEERKAKAEEEKARFYALQVLNQEYRIKIKEQNEIIEKLAGEANGNYKECIEREMDLHRQVIDLLKSERDLKEEIIFLKILNKKQ